MRVNMNKVTSIMALQVSKAQASCSKRFTPSFDRTIDRSSHLMFYLTAKI